MENLHLKALIWCEIAKVQLMSIDNRLNSIESNWLAIQYHVNQCWDCYSTTIYKSVYNYQWLNEQQISLQEFPIGLKLAMM